ncbi:MAG: hypothetical protein LBH82_06970 [Bacteroidales bacterium]|jgi:hypothetical protein|nr:hypothetical protein [Bacteroidales bacterium]
MRKWKAFMFFLVSVFFLISCSKRTFYKNRPKKGAYRDIEYFGSRHTINPNDTITINKYSSTGYFTVIKIKEEKKFYSIIITNDSMRIYHSDYPYHIIEQGRDSYQIISLKGKITKGREEIKLWQRYKLTLNPVLIPIASDIIIMPSSYIQYVYIKGMWIPIEMCCGENIYTTPNLDGLYYIP